MTLKIRPAARQDCPTILNFIKLLATYEKLEHEAIVDLQQLETTLFDTKTSTEVFLGSVNNKHVCFALIFQNYSTFLGKPGLYLEDLFVLEDQRGKGYGKKMLQFLAKLAVEKNCGRLEWSVLDWNTPAIEFYKSIGAVALEGWTINRLTGKALQKLALQY